MHLRGFLATRWPRADLFTREQGMMMKIGFTGSRSGMTAAQRLVLSLSLGQTIDEFHHGSCVGADVDAARIASANKQISIVAHPGPANNPYMGKSGVDHKTRRPAAFLVRNRMIVDAADEVVACQCDMVEQARGGTWYTVRYARQQRKPVTIIWPDGSMQRS